MKFARTPAGRKVLKEAIRIARSDEGRKLIAQARKVASSPEGKRLLDQAKHRPAPDLTTFIERYELGAHKFE